jgi:PAS domain S-box-containing protein
LGDLKISQSRFRRLAEANIIGIATVKHPDMLVIEANDAFLNMIGYNREDLSMGEIYLRDLTPPEYAPLDAQATAEAKQSGVASPWVKEYIRKDGSRIPVMVGYAILDGQPDTSVGFVIDLTERKKSEEAQRFLTDASRVLAASLDAATTLESLANLIVPRYADRCIIDLVDEDGKISRITVKDVEPSNEPLAYQVQKWRKAELVQPRGITRTLHTGESQFYPEVLESDLHLHMQDEASLDILRKLRISSQIIVPLIARGRTLGAMSLVYTTSGRRYTPADLVLIEDLGRRTALAVDNARLYEESQQAIHLRDEFLSVAAHELKTPVTSLRGFAQVTLRQLEKTNDFDLERTRRAFINIDQQSDKLARLVTQLLSIARIQAGRLILDLEQTDFVRLVEDVVTAAQMRTAKHTIALEAPVILPITCDPLRLEQVITNLVDNAIKYSPDGGDIDIEITRPESNRVHFMITDHGIGIAPEHRGKIFQRFYQAQKRTYLEGMGLGLYISHEIVVLHGGTIQVEFPSEGGTRFIVSLPTGLEDEPFS